MRSRPILVVPTILSLALSACQIPRFQGPEIQEPPPNFQRQPGTDTPPVFTDHDVTFHTAWVHTDLGGVSVISVDEHAAVFGVEDVIAAQERARASEMDADAIFGEVEALRVDGRDAWGWYRYVESPRRGLVEVTYTAVVPYDSVSYALRFSSGEPSLKRAAPDTLRAVISSFGIGRTTYNLPLIAIVFGALLLLVSVARARARKRSDRMKSINLVTIQRDEEDEVTGQAGEVVSHADAVAIQEDGATIQADGAEVSEATPEAEPRRSATGEAPDS